MKIDYEKIKGILTIDDKKFSFDMESEMIFQELHKDGLFKFMKSEKEILNPREGLIHSLLNLDLSVIKFVLYASQEESTKLVLSDFEEYYRKLIKDNQTEINVLCAKVYEMFGGYIEFLGFPQAIERGLMIIQEKIQAEALNTILTSTSFIARTIKSQMVEALKNSAN